ncbi:DUF317 domain-containing protein [Streptomyces iconiensis]|uniref:DUF317 domain-containing protein n=1 Tax=Streptomyces iconiensis TaxID=1384038 RepID=A0ABT6ZSF4_9ACTN|nr:DUF317 domain-containing protein [Streptomyces iconiensis]MDJ1131991.1 DUF317 domain-containing protein [Streptomyces iconiensis]
MPYASPGSGDVLVAPGYLAGTTGTDTVRPLLDGRTGWTQALVNFDVYYTSPCQRLRAVNSPLKGWTFTYAADPLGVPTWITTFDRGTPDEIVRAFTGTLTDGLDNYFRDHLSGGPRYTGHTPARLFAAHEWEPVPGPRPWRMLSPDGHAAFQIRTGHLEDHHELRDPTRAMWKITAGPDPVLPDAQNADEGGVQGADVV